MRKIITALMIFTTVVANAQRGTEINLWPEGPNTDSGDPTDMAKVTVFLPDEKRATGRAIVICPGGGYDHLAFEKEGTLWAPLFNSMGIAVAVLKYRMPHGNSGVPLEDAEQAMRLMRRMAAQWHIDTEQVGIMGFSAGGHLAASAATLFTSDANRPDFQVLLYPVILFDTPHGTRNNLLGKNPSSELIERYSLEKQVTPNTPRAFVVLAADDRTVPAAHSLKYCLALTENKVSTMLLMYPYGDHGFGCQDRFAFKNQWLSELEHWLHTF